MSHHGLADPLRLDWLDLSAAPRFKDWAGRLGMTILPGKQQLHGMSGAHMRTLETDARQLATDGVTTFVLLVEDHELIEFKVEPFVEVMAASGIETLRFPIADQRTPTDPLAFAELLTEIGRRLSEGQTIGVSCLGGLGRTGTLAACLLVDGGLDAETAMTTTRAARKGAIENHAQEAFVRRWVGRADSPMDRSSPAPIERRTYDAAVLMESHPPILRDPNKRIVFDIACPPGSPSRGELEYSRWAEMTPPRMVHPGRAAELVEVRPGYFDYARADDLSDAVEWHVNFADPHLFVAYGSSLFAQDEMQVAEHPILGSLREALNAEGHRASTTDGDRATPVLVVGAERRCRIETDPSPAEGRPAGLYGNAFARASADAVMRATTRIVPPTITNLIAMAAPPGGSGRYDQATIESILNTAYTGFRSAVIASRRAEDEIPVVLHTGYWGCGAFGGNRVLMSVLQILAAEMAGLERLVFHTGMPGGDAALAEGLALLAGHPEAIETRSMIDRLHSHGFEWGVSDGN